MEKKIEDLKKIVEKIETIQICESLFGNLTPDEIHDLRVLNEELLQKVKEL